MSTELHPKWAEIDISTLLESARCPECGEVPDNAQEDIEEYIYGNYYCVAHIPRQMLFDCSNDECSHCDKGFALNIATIELKPAKASYSTED